MWMVDADENAERTTASPVGSSLALLLGTTVGRDKLVSTKVDNPAKLLHIILCDRLGWWT